jgi:glycosyltransferase involved in cell wall biosynthesis/O-antigen/teichoic acid export membrane protein
MHILVLTDRDWTHPQGGGTGTNLFGQISRWLAWGHRVTVVASSYPGAAPEERIGSLTIHRMGGRGTVFPRAIWKVRRGLVPDADVVLEVINGITFLTPLWLRLPRVALIHHVHREHYAQELGRFGKVAAFLLETAPLRWLYTGSRFQTLSHAEAEKIGAHGIPLEAIDVNYIGVELDAFGPGERAPEPTLLYLGRLKKYKRIELLLDVLEQVPEAVLEVAGEGDHRPVLEAEIERRGLSDRVRMHGHVSEDRKHELLQRAWVNLTASSAEGWCLTVMEAGACATPTAALAVGGLPESIDDGRTGALARDAQELGDKVRAIVADPAERDRLGHAALERARTFTWDAAAQRSLDGLEAARAETPQSEPLRNQFARSDTGRAAGLAAAVMAANLVSLIFTVAFARILGTSGYGTLAALVSTFLILQVPGSALQITVAREVSTAIALGHEAPGAGVRRWLGRIAILTLAVTAAAILVRDQLAAVIGVDAVWAAAATIPTGCLWLLASVERGALQGFQRYRAVGMSIVGEASARLLFGLLLVAVGLDVTGAFLGTACSVLGMALILLWPLHQELERSGSLHVPAAAVQRFRDLAARAWAPVAGLALLLILQEIHVIVVKHEASDDAAGAYAAAAVAAKAIIWVAVGLGLYLLPEAARRTKSGIDARPVLVRTLALIGLLALPMVLVYTVAARPLLEIVFGEDFGPAASALPWLGMSMALLACVYLAVQYLLALGQARFIVVLGIAAVAEPLLLLLIGAQLRDIALALFGLQLALAAVVTTISFRSAAHPDAAPVRERLAV